MTREELEQYSELNNKFYEACKRYCKAMEKYDYYEYCNINTFEIQGTEISGSGWDRENDYYSVYFDAECLLMTDEELDKHVQDQINKRKKEQEERNKRSVEAKEKADRKLYEELRKRFG